MSFNGYSNFQTFTVANAIYNTDILYSCFKNAVKEVQEKFPKEARVSALSNILKKTQYSARNHIQMT